MGTSIFEEWNKNTFSYAKYNLFALDEGFYCWIVDGGVQNVWTNTLILEFIIPQINYWLRWYIYNMNIRAWSHESIQAWSSLHELSKNKKDCYKAYMVTYRIDDWIKAGAHLGEGSIEFGSLTFFKTHQILPSGPSK